MQTDGTRISRATGPRRDPPAVCYTCGNDVEDGPRFGAEATCDECRRNPPVFAVFAFDWPMGDKTLRMVQVVGGAHHRSTISEDTARELGIEVRG